MAKYQHASDAVEGMPPYSGVIRDDGRWVANAANNELWEEYLEWAKDAKNVPDPFKAPADGGLTIKLQEGEEATGAMVPSLPPEPPATSPPTPPPTTGSGPAAPRK